MQSKQLYKAICDQAEDLPLFLQHWWLDIVCAVWDVAIARKGDQITGVWPYQVERRLWVGLRRTPLLTPYLGPHVFYPADLKPVNRDSYEHETIAQLLQQLPDEKVWNLSIQPGCYQAGLFHSQGLKSVARQTFRIDLQQPEDTIFGLFRENLRRNVRSAEKELRITDDPACIETLYEFQKSTLSRKNKGLAHDLPLLSRLFEACYSRGCARLWVARRGDRVQAVVWVAWDQQCCYYLAGGQNPDAEGYKAMSALLWHAIREARALGLKTYDLEGSMDPGVERFFRSFGAERTLYLVLRRNISASWTILEWIGKR